MLPTTAGATPGARPFWMPKDLKFDKLSPDLQQAIIDLIDPVYEELVLQAQTGLERAMGATYTHLFWLAVIQMIDIAHSMSPELERGRGTDKHQEKIARHLRLLAQKDRIAKCLFEMKKFYERGGDKDRLGQPR